jgi:hypothetical protein
MGASPCWLPAVALPGTAARGRAEGQSLVEHGQDAAKELGPATPVSRTAREAGERHKQDNKQYSWVQAGQGSWAQQARQGEQFL